MLLSASALVLLPWFRVVLLQADFDRIEIQMAYELHEDSCMYIYIS